MSHKPTEVAVLNVMAGAADVTLSGGRFAVNEASVDLIEEIKVADGTGLVKTAYAPGTPSVKTYDFAAVALAANSQYRFAVVIDGRIDFNGGGSEANELIPIREYVVWTGAAPAAATDLVDLIVDRIALDADADVSAANAGGLLEITLLSVDEGDFRAETDAVEAIPTPFVAASGTPAIVEGFAPTASSPTGEYTTWQVNYDHYRRHNGVGGGKAAFPEFVLIFADETAANFAAMETELDAVLAGTHTPVADYLGL
ncbi:MAG: hypothetical protein ACXAB7_09995 [Candidatus Kariarchaeaceae archaeon]|jgi:hypothetical protein